MSSLERQPHGTPLTPDINNLPPVGTVRAIILRMATPSFMAFPTYKFGCDRRCSPVVSVVNSVSCQSTLSSTSPWHTADRSDFFFPGHLPDAFGFFRAASSPFHKFLVLCPKTAPCPKAAAQVTTAAAAALRMPWLPFFVTNTIL